MLSYREDENSYIHVVTLLLGNCMFHIPRAVNQKKPKGCRQTLHLSDTLSIKAEWRAPSRSTSREVKIVPEGRKPADRGTSHLTTVILERWKKRSRRKNNQRDPEWQHKYFPLGQAHSAVSRLFVTPLWRKSAAAVTDVSDKHNLELISDIFSRMQRELMQWWIFTGAETT